MKRDLSESNHVPVPCKLATRGTLAFGYRIWPAASYTGSGVPYSRLLLVVLCINTKCMMQPAVGYTQYMKHPAASYTRGHAL